jgi:hypothetical protein
MTAKSVMERNFTNLNKIQWGNLGTNSNISTVIINVAIPNAVTILSRTPHITVLTVRPL